MLCTMCHMEFKLGNEDRHKYKRIVVYVKDDDHRETKAKLALDGNANVSEWFREIEWRYINSR